MPYVVVAVSNGAVRSSIAVAARTMGHQVLAVADAGELLAMVKDRPPDVLFLDPMLARLETVEPLRVMRVENRLVGVRIVLVDDHTSVGGPWAPLVRQLADGIIESFRGPDVTKAIDAAIGLGKHNAATAGPAPPPPPASRRAGSPRTPPPAHHPAPVHAPAHAPAASAPAADAASADEGPRRPTIVLVEDLPQLRALLGIRLESEGWSVQWFGTAEDATRHIEAHGAEVILSDINLPGMSGDQFVGLVRKRFPGVFCFLMTALPRDRWPRVPPSVRIFAKPLDLVSLVHALKEARDVRTARNS